MGTYTTAYICVFILYNLSCVLSLYRKYPVDTSELVFTSILYRHGERNPESLYPKDPYKNLSYWPEGLGMLTNNGILQHYELGQWLRKRYDSLIPGGKYNHDLMYVRSTDWDRTLMSAQANLAGMFSPSQDQRWGTLDWQPIPVHTIPKDLDKLLSVHYPCPRMKHEKKVIKHSEVVKKFNEQHEDTYKFLSKHTGSKVKSPAKAEHFYVTFLIETLHNYTLPNWTKSIYPDKLNLIGSFGFQMRTMTKTMKRLRGGPLLKDMLKNMKQKKEGTLTPNRNLWIYSGHDTTVAALLDTMGVFQPHLPPFAATVMVELRKNKNQDFFVEVYYKDSKDEPSLLTIPGCSASCPLNKFESLLEDVIPKDWDAECKRSHNKFEKETEEEMDDEE